MAGEDIDRHRSRLEDLRREVEALSLVNAAAAQNLPVEALAEASVGISNGNGSLSDGRFEARNRRLEMRVEELEARREAAEEDVESGEAERKELLAAQANAKSDWNKVLAQCAAKEQKAKKKIAITRKEIEKVQSGMRKAEAAHKCERVKVQQRSRNYRMQLRQMARQVQEVVASETGASVEDVLAGIHSSRHNKDIKGAFFQLKTFENETARLRHRRAQLLDSKAKVEEKLRNVQKRGHLSDRSAELLELEARQKDEEEAYVKEGRDLRAELQQLAREQESARRELARIEQARERSLADLNEREWAFRRHHETETQKLQTIDEYLHLNGHQALHDRIEADVSRTQCRLVQSRLEEVERDAGARIHVLQASIQELRADIARKTAVVEELSTRLGGKGEASSPPNGKTPEDRAAEAFRDEALRNMGVVAEGDVSNPSGGLDLDRRAAQAELEHQRGLLDLRRGQVAALETRLAEYVEAQGPYCDALRGWLASQGPRLSQTGPRLERREDIEQMQRERTHALQYACQEWEEQRQRLTEESEAARRGAEASAKRLREVETQREQVLKKLDKVLKAERAHGQRSAPLIRELERDRERCIRQEVAHRLQEIPPSARRKAISRSVKNEARDHVLAQRKCQSEALCELTAQHRDIAAELTFVDEALAEVTFQEELAHRETQAEEKSPRSPMSPRSPKSPKGENQSQRRSNSCPARPRNAQIAAIERRRVQREADLMKSVEQLQTMDADAEKEQQRMMEREKELKKELEEAQKVLDEEVAKSRSATAAAQRQYVQANAQYLEFEKKTGSLALRRDELTKALSEAQEDLQKNWEVHRSYVRRMVEDHGTTPSSSGHPSTCSTPIGVRSVTSLVPFFRQSAERMAEPEIPEARGPLGSHVTMGPGPGRDYPSRPAPPSMTEVKRKHGNDEALCNFYNEVYHLLKGADIQVWKKPRQRFEIRCLLLSSDLQRLELWPASYGPPRRVAEGFVRVDAVSRVHIPKATLLAVQQNILESEPAVGSAEMGSGSDGDGASSAKPARPKSAAPVSKGPPSFSFDLVLDAAEPWRLATNEVHTFHVVTTAIQTLHSVRGSLASYASALGLQ
eukprot:gnl/MRDRNA2_/MRDRNA2_29832_c0_seq1.p1 gnl/MRDRNA2_/MRDRNA2_29832_c0~~gnl/MRDRNA2_/MRDRNA2_29832_c0_seq1.p1  ORF type:complete len:1093 (+),score=243.40 gnl/MRDRNA2_/MRDRNA2_29832_c0_seq1:156-3434(+)